MTGAGRAPASAAESRSTTASKIAVSPSAMRNIRSSRRADPRQKPIRHYAAVHLDGAFLSEKKAGGESSAAGVPRWTPPRAYHTRNGQVLADLNFSSINWRSRQNPDRIFQKKSLPSHNSLKSSF